MPKNQFFSFSVAVGGFQVEEQLKDGVNYIEADLFGPHSRKEVSIDLVNGTEETQDSSVLPYKINIDLCKNVQKPAWAFVIVDGYSVCKVLVHPGRIKTVHGFRDGDNIREFLFSMPRFGFDKENRIEESRLKAVGTIKVVLKEAIYRNTFKKLYFKQNQAKLDFTQATKKDSQSVTKGEYLMATTKVGKSVEGVLGKRKRSGDQWYSVDIFDEGRELGNLKLKYFVKSTLSEMGIVTDN